MNKDLTIAEFKRLVAIHGGDFARWPVEVVRAASRMVEVDEEARAVHQEALALDGMLAAYGDVGPLPDMVAARVMQDIERAPGRALNDNFAGLPGLTRRMGVRSWAGMAAACLVAVMLWTQQPAPQPVTGGTQQMAAAADVDAFLLAMADPFIEALQTEDMMAPLEMAALRRASYEVDVFLDDLMGEELDSLFMP